MQKVAARGRSTQPGRNRDAAPAARNAVTVEHVITRRIPKALQRPITDADRADARRIVDQARAAVPVPEPDKVINGQAAAAIFGHLAANRADAEASEIAATGDAWGGFGPGQSAAREASLRRSEATSFRASANLELEPRVPLLAVMGEVIPARALGEERPVTNQRAHLLNTLERPTTISVNASQRRLGLLSDAGSVALGVDTAHSWQAANSVEQMLCHQLASVHGVAMRLIGFLGESQGPSDRRLPPVECARLGNTAARLIEAFQAGCLTLQKLKTGGAQRVIVQRQQIVQTKDGQTLVIGELKQPRSTSETGSCGRGGRVGKMPNEPLAPPRFAFLKAPRCGARCKRTGRPCAGPACCGKARCRMHGGKSTGPRTTKGLERSQRARLVHRFYSRQLIEARRQARVQLRLLRAFLGSR